MNDTGPISGERTMTVEEAIRGRKSTRAFLKTPVPRELIARILTTAGRAPSGSNIQPWKVYVVDGAARDALAADLCHRYDTVGEGQREYEYYPVKWREPYLARRRACGWGLYSTMGITRDDKAGMHAQRRQNYEFFGAPTAFIFTIDRELEQGSWLDTGMFIQSIMIAARQFGLETIPQAALANYHEVLRARLGIPDSEIVICGMGIGYPDTNAKVNTFTTDREPLENFVTWIDSLKPAKD
ncbi:MAG: nitroreductase [Hyphomicrobiaceae bacterium]